MLPCYPLSYVRESFHSKGDDYIPKSGLEELKCLDTLRGGKINYLDTNFHYSKEIQQYYKIALNWWYTTEYRHIEQLSYIDAYNCGDRT